MQLRFHVFWDVVLCCWVSISWCLGGSWHLHLATWHSIKKHFALCTLEDEGNKILTGCQELLTQGQGFNAKTLEFLYKVYCKDFSL